MISLYCAASLSRIGMRERDGQRITDSDRFHHAQPLTREALLFAQFRACVCETSVAGHHCPSATATCAATVASLR